MFAPGDVLGQKYRLDRLLGEGGMGAVFAAENLNTGRRVAVKVLHAALMTHPEAGARFVREARATTAIAHPNIVDVLDLESDAARQVVYIVQEFLEGETLEALLARRDGHRLSPEEAVTLTTPVMEALVAAHARGIVHRDLKPGNLFLVRRPDGDVTPKVIDFGIAKDIARADPANQTREGTTIGTPAYMSPEQVAGRADVDAQTDVWALGVVLYEALSGRLPYEAETFNLLMAKILYEPPTPLTAYAPWLPPALVEVVSRALQRERALRFRTMREMLDATRAAAPESRDLPAAPAPSRTSASAPLAQTVAGGPASVQPAPHTLQAQWRPATLPPGPPRTRWALAMGVIGLAALVGVTVVRMTSANHARREAATAHPNTAPTRPVTAVPASPVTAVPASPETAAPTLPETAAPARPAVAPVETPRPPDATEAAVRGRRDRGDTPTAVPGRRARRAPRGGAATVTTPRHTVLGAEEM